MEHYKTVEQYALQDMAEYFKDKECLIYPTYLANKKVRKLNRELGITSVNHFDNQRGRKNK